MADNLNKMMHDCFNSLEDDNIKDLYSKFLKEFDRPLIEVVLKKTRGNKVKTAEILGINRNTLSKKMKELDLCSKSFK